MAKKFNELKEQITIAELAAQYGYVINREKNTNNWMALINMEYNDKIILPSNQQGRRYKSSNSSDAGDIFDFIYHRLDSVFSKWSKENKTPYTAALDCLNDYLGLSTQQKEKNHTIASISGKEIDAKTKQFNLDNYHLMPFTEVYYLVKTRQIDPDTIKSPLFTGKILNSQTVKDGVLSNFVKTCFPYQNSLSDARYTGLSLRDGGKYPKLFAEGTDRNMGVWISNPVGKIDTIHIAENEIDCLSHYQLNKANLNNPLYISVGGSFTPGQMETVKTITDELKKQDQLADNFKYVLNFDNNIAGCNYDTYFIQNLDNSPQPFGKVNLGINSPSIQYNFFNIEQNKDVLKSLELNLHYANDKLKSVWDKLSDQPLPTAHLFEIKPTQSDTISVIFPKNGKILEIFNRALIIALDKSNLVEIHKPKLTDFNDDLKMKNQINHKLNQDSAHSFDLIAKQDTAVKLNFNNFGKNTQKLN